MRPILFEIGPITLYSYGLMIAIGFLAGYWVLIQEHKQLKLDPKRAGTLLIIALAGGLAGAKLLFLIGEWSAFIENPVHMVFSPAGLTWYGGFIVALAALYYYVRKNNLPTGKYLDMGALAASLGYPVGRLACQLAGDGTYGTPTNLPWGTIFANGTNKPAHALADYFSRNPEKAELWNYNELSGIVVGSDRFGTITAFDTNVAMHPAALYTFIVGIIVFGFLWGYRKRFRPPGMLFSVAVLLMAIQRFLIETIRLNPRILFNLTEAQLISILLAVASVIAIVLLKKNYRSGGNGKRSRMQYDN